MTKKVGLKAGLAVCIALGALAAVWTTLAQAQGMGPREVAEIPIESVPAWVSEGVWRRLPDEADGGMEVLAVLRDPRDVPIDRFLYALTDENEVMVHPQAEAIRQAFEGRAHSAVAVYVRVRAPQEICEDCYEGDPFFVARMERQSGGFRSAWDAVGVYFDSGGVGTLPCVEPMTIEAGAAAFRAPDTGERLRPDEYLPPEPRYRVKDKSETGLSPGEMTAGEVREGWILCLAPDVPADEVRIVDGIRVFEDVGILVNTGGYWVPWNELQVGEWLLLEEQQVVAWNEERPGREFDDPIRVDEQIVYEGDVWMTVAQGLRHVGNPPFEEMRLVMYFEGMEELLAVWDRVALAEELLLTWSSDPRVAHGPDWPTTGGADVELLVEGTSVVVTYNREPVQVAWVSLGRPDKPSGTDPVPLWRVEFEEIDERELSTDGVCAQTECTTISFPRYGEDVVAQVPLIPPGMQAWGVTVQSTQRARYPLLEMRGMDMVVDDGRFGCPGGECEEDRARTVIEVDAEGLSANVLDFGGDSSCGVSSGYYCFGDAWVAWARSGGPVFLWPSAMVADDNNLRTRYTGPVFSLP
ncbi:MAG: hypothetical protein FJZ97_07135 [Chloroflexi bacterium]|nr:hypothetical protein [Chloroflexota bacterium]